MDGKAVVGRGSLGRLGVAFAARTTASEGRTAAGAQPTGRHRYFVRAQKRHSLGDAPKRAGLRLGDDLLAATQTSGSRPASGSAFTTSCSTGWEKPTRSTGAARHWTVPACRQKGGPTHRRESDGSWKTGHEAPPCGRSQGYPACAEALLRPTATTASFSRNCWRQSLQSSAYAAGLGADPKSSTPTKAMTIALAGLTYADAASKVASHAG